MSRIGKQPITIPEGVTVDRQGASFNFKGPLGELKFDCPANVNVAISDNQIIVKPENNSKQSRSFWGMTRTLLANCADGVKDGFSKTLEVKGVGYKASMQGKDLLRLSLGYSHDILYRAPKNIEITVQGQDVIIKGASKQLVGQVAAEIRAFRKPEPYKGKGVRYKDEVVLLKAGKKK